MLHLRDMLLTSCHDTTLTQLWHYTLHNRSGMTFVPFHIIYENHMMDAWCWIWKVPWKLTLHGLALRHSRHLLSLLLLAGRRQLDPVPDVPGSVLLLVPSLSLLSRVCPLLSLSECPAPSICRPGRSDRIWTLVLTRLRLLGTCYSAQQLLTRAGRDDKWTNSSAKVKARYKLVDLFRKDHFAPISSF